MLGLSRRAALQASLLLPAFRANAAKAYPDRPVRLLVGFAPGGAVDLVARILAVPIGQSLGQPVIVDNRTGASGNIASGEAVRAAPDGNTLLLGNGPQLVMNPFLFPGLPFKPERDLLPIAQAATVRFVAVVPAQSPAKDLTGFVALTRQKPATYGSSGIGSVQHLGAELFKAASGAVMTHVPYRGSGPMMTDLLAGRLDFAIDAESVVGPYARSGTLRPLATMAAARAPGLPDVPTIAEAGYGDILVEGWQGLVAPAGTPADIIATLSAALERALRQDDVLRRFESASIVPIYRDQAAFAAFLASERRRWGPIITRLDLKL